MFFGLEIILKTMKIGADNFLNLEKLPNLYRNEDINFITVYRELFKFEQRNVVWRSLRNICATFI